MSFLSVEFNSATVETKTETIVIPLVITALKKGVHALKTDVPCFPWKNTLTIFCILTVRFMRNNFWGLEFPFVFQMF